MTDLRELLDRIAGEPAPPTPDVVTSDVRRGRSALRRRRGLRVTSGLVLATAAAAVGVAVVPNLGGDAPRTVLTPGGTSSRPGVALVPWDQGGVPKPISPGLVPEAWTVSGSEYALVISPPGVSTSVDDFRGKLVAGLAQDSAPADGARPVTVGPGQGTLSREGDTTILLFALPDGRQMDVQAPRSLGWDTATLVRFAERLTVSADAPSSVG